MCGRYALAWGLRHLRQQMRDAGMQVEEEIDDDEDEGRVRQSYNVAPGYFEPVYRAVVNGENQDHQDNHQNPAREEQDEEMQGTEESSYKEAELIQGEAQVKYILQPMKWGLVPFWTKRNPDYGSLMRTINCRDDSLFGNTGMWTSMKNKKRCIVVAQGFYEWLQKGKDKVPHFTKRTDGQVLCMAGLWDSVKYEDATEPLYTYSIITTSSSKQLSFLHDRMPVIFEPGSEEIRMWLDPKRTWDTGLQSLLQPWEKSGLECYPVKKEVGKVGNNSPSFIVPLDSKENKSNIKNFFASGEKKTDATPNEAHEIPQDAKTEEGEEEVGEEEEEGDEPFEDTRGTRDDEEISELNSENNAPLPAPSQPSPEPSPTKSTPTTPLLTRTTKRKLGEMSPATTLPPTTTSPSKSPSPLKLQSTYSSTDIGSGPKRGVFSDSPSKKSKTKAPDARDLGNKNIMSFFEKK